MGKAATFTRRAALLLGGAALGYGLGRSWAPGLSQLEGVPPIAQSQGEILNDASQLSATPIHIHTRPTSHGDALIEAFRTELKAARAENRPVNVGAARHSMGGQAIPRDGHAITVDNAQIDVDT
ncbi:MAG: FAD-binding oxidoreductase, partial [Pseudomonadota bacterium]